MGNRSPIAALFVAAVALVALAGIASAQYWFQTGMRGSTDSAFNNGASVQIETVFPQNTTAYGSYGFWTGETLSNGAFVQAGYEVPNESGDYPTNCTPGGSCTGQVYLQAGVPTWFWEYFPSGSTGDNFYGSIGPNDSVGANGTFNTYAFNSSGNTWNFWFNSKRVGSAALGASGSDANPVTAFAEDANSNSNSAYMIPVKFRNLMMYKDGAYRLVPTGYSYIGYGAGSDTTLHNPYGIREVSQYTNYFEVGSGLPQLANYTQLWSIGYTLKVDSEYGNISRVTNYTAYAKVQLSAPAEINVSPVERYMFNSWRGSGSGSYTGPSASVTVTMDGNITETAVWTVQYYLNVTSAYDHAIGSGWYDANSTASFGLQTGMLAIGYGERAKFSLWSDGSSALQSTVVMAGPESVSAKWTIQYLVNATSQYGGVYGNGWYDANSTAHVYLSNYSVPVDGTHRIAFSSWSDGNTNESRYFKVDRSIMLGAIFLPQVLASFRYVDVSGNLVNVSYIYANGERLNSTSFVFTGRNYTVTEARYGRLNLSINSTFRLAAPGTITIGLPMYSVTLLTTNIFGEPLNASVDLSFKNGSTYSGSLGSKGAVTFAEVPYGYVIGSASYQGITEPIYAENRSMVNLIFFTPLVIAAILAAGALVIVITVAELRRRKGAK